MGTLLAYSLMVGAVLILLYFVVKLGLSGTTFHSFNRKVILLCYVLALALPFVMEIQVPWLQSEPVADVVIEIPEYAAVVTDAVVDSSVPLWMIAGLGVYVAGIIFFLFREMVIFFRMYRLLSSCETIDNHSRWKIMLHERNDIAPFSWANGIVMSRKDYIDGGRTIIAHETAHLERYHSIDLFIAEIVTILVWYNPAAWLMREELSTVHEYETDEAVLRQGFNARDYQLLLIKKAVGSRFPSIANSLDHSNLSKRIKMMLQKRTSPGRRWIAAAALPAIALSAVLFSNHSVASTLEEISDAKVTDSQVNRQEASLEKYYRTVDNIESDTVVNVEKDKIVVSYGNAKSLGKEPVKTEIPQTSNTQNVNDESVFDRVENMPHYPGGEVELMKFISKNLKYPKEAIDDSITGRVIVRFIVKKNGDIGNVEVLRGRHKLLDDEAVRVIKLINGMEPGTMNGKPVNVRYVLPIEFRLMGEKSDDKPKKFTDEELKDKVFTAVEQMPEYPGGMDALMKDLMKNLKYPKDAGQGRVIVQFVVTTTGTVGDVKVLRSMSPELDKAAMDAVKPLHFKPGRMNGKPVNVLYTLPVMFRQVKEQTAE